MDGCARDMQHSVKVPLFDRGRLRAMGQVDDLVAGGGHNHYPRNLMAARRQMETKTSSNGNRDTIRGPDSCLCDLRLSGTATSVLVSYGMAA